MNDVFGREIAGFAGSKTMDDDREIVYFESQEAARAYALKWFGSPVAPKLSATTGLYYLSFEA